MKKLKVLLLFLSALMLSCSSDEDSTSVNPIYGVWESINNPDPNQKMRIELYENKTFLFCLYENKKELRKRTGTWKILNENKLGFNYNKSETNNAEDNNPLKEEVEFSMPNRDYLIITPIKFRRVTN